MLWFFMEFLTLLLLSVCFPVFMLFLSSAVLLQFKFGLQWLQSPAVYSTKGAGPIW